MFLREVMFVPETMPVEELWTSMKAGHHYMAIVFDEYGGTAGIVTQEDLIEEIFGEVQDEFDQEGPLIAYGDDEDVVLRGDVLVSDVNEYLLLNLPLNQADTIGGLVTSHLGRPASPGDRVQIGAHLLRVQEVDDLAVTQVSLTLPDDIEPMLDGERAQ
jgi:CBS domain containing-hemolysin-like protein